MARLFHALAERLGDRERAVQFVTKSALVMYLEDIRGYDGNHILPRNDSEGPFLQLLIDARENIQLGPLIFTLFNEFGTEGIGANYSQPFISAEWFEYSKTMSFNS